MVINLIRHAYYFGLKNDDETANHNICPIGGPWDFFSRMRILANGQVIEDIDSNNRVHELLQVFSATASRAHAYS